MPRRASRKPGGPFLNNYTPQQADQLKKNVNVLYATVDNITESLGDEAKVNSVLSRVEEVIKKWKSRMGLS